MSSQPNTTHAAHAVGLSDPQYTARKKHMFEFLTRLRSIGADIDLDVPAIAVVGWQSAGKSSLIEAISGITLPRAGGTCTRCPTECRLTHSDAPWSCSVSLRLTNAPDGSTREIPFGVTITEKSEVTERIRRAQRAILSPSTPTNDFLSRAESDFDQSEIAFSPNCIVLHISGPDVTDLNFIDLPGLFVGGLDAEINIIRDLAISYMQRPSCIILLTVACETDFINQGAHRLAQEYDPRGERTIGVLTKPDRIPPTEEGNWLPYIRGEREDTTSWFCVKCPNSQAINSGITWERAREEESEFFSHMAPWSMLEGESRQRLGSGNLTRHLSEKLCDLIAERLPAIRQELDRLLEKTKQELRGLPPPPPSEPLREILRLIMDFTRAVEKQVEGVPGRGGLLQQIKPRQEEFRVAIRTTAPCFVPRYKGSQSQEMMSEGGTNEDWEPYRRLSFLEGEEDYGEIGLDNGKEIFIDDVLETAEWAVTRELPNNYPFIVQRGYIIDTISQWDAPAKTLFDITVMKLKEITLRVVVSYFGLYAHGGLKRRVSEIVTAHLNQCAEETLALIEFLLQVEKEPSTKNVYYFKDYRRNFFAFYKGIFNCGSNSDFVERVQRHVDQPPGFTEALGIIIANLSKIGFHDVSPLQLTVLQTSEDADGAIKIMADVRAYFQVAYKRFADNVPKAIDERLVLGAARGLQGALATGLGLDSIDAHEKCAKLLAEPLRIAEKREKLVARQGRLTAANDELLDHF